MLILLRHGRTPNNADAKLQGQIDSPLDEVGRHQARIAGDFLRHRYDVSEVVTSSLARTRQTVEHAGFGHLVSTVDDRWAEIRFGHYDGRRIREAIVELGRRWADDVDYEPPGGESLATMHRRVCAACEETIASSVERDILVVTHATPIKAAVVWAMGGEARQILNLRSHLAAVTVIDASEDQLLVVEYNRRLGAPESDDPVRTAGISTTEP